jgi:hypothetical protein
MRCCIVKFPQFPHSTNNGAVNLMLMPRRRRVRAFDVFALGTAISTTSLRNFQ